MFIAAIAGVSFAQKDSCAAKEVALYDEYAFNDKDGVQRLYHAYNLAVGHAPHTGITDLETSKKRFDARKKILVEPVLKEIRASLADVARANDLVLLEMSELDHRGVLLAFDKKFDVSRQLIDYLNRQRFAAQKTFIVSVGKSRIGIIDTRQFFDPQRGIRGLALAPGEDVGSFCGRTKQCAEVGRYLEEYARKNGISLILDSGKSLPKEINPLTCENLTSDFVSEYNKHSLSLSRH